MNKYLCVWETFAIAIHISKRIITVFTLTDINFKSKIYTANVIIIINLVIHYIIRQLYNITKNVILIIHYILCMRIESLLFLYKLTTKQRPNYVKCS